MQQMDSETAENYTSEPLYDVDRLRELLRMLSTEQLRFITARQECSSDKEAAEMIGLTPQTVYRWPPEVDEAARLMACDGLLTAREVLRRNLTKAALVKVGGLDSNEERLRQGVATEIIEWEMGKPVQKQEVTGKDGSDLIVRVVYGDRGNASETA